MPKDLEGFERNTLHKFIDFAGQSVLEVDYVRACQIVHNALEEVIILYLLKLRRTKDSISPASPSSDTFRRPFSETTCIEIPQAEKSNAVMLSKPFWIGAFVHCFFSSQVMEWHLRDTIDSDHLLEAR